MAEVHLSTVLDKGYVLSIEIILIFPFLCLCFI